MDKKTLDLIFECFFWIGIGGLIIAGFIYHCFLFQGDLDRYFQYIAEHREELNQNKDNYKGWLRAHLGILNVLHRRKNNINNTNNIQQIIKIDE